MNYQREKTKQSPITFANLVTILNEIGVKSTAQRFFYVDEIPKIVYEDLDGFLLGKTIGVKNDRKIIYHADIIDWLQKVWEKGLT